MSNRNRIADTETDMRGMWCIIKGQYKPSLGVESYDPESDLTYEWYQVLDRYTYTTISCGSKIERVLRGLKNHILEFKTQECFYRFLSDNTTEDYYQTHFLGLPPHSERQKDQLKKEGVMCAVSEPTKELYKDVVEMYGDFFSDIVSDTVESAYKDLFKREHNVKSRRTTLKKKKPLTARNTNTQHNDSVKNTNTDSGHNTGSTQLKLKPKKSVEPIEVLDLEEEPIEKKVSVRSKLRLIKRH